MRRVWTLAIEALSWMELEGLNSSSALRKTVNQLGIRDGKTISEARSLINECLRRRNFIDKIVNHAVAPASLIDFNLGVQAFLRLYTYRTKFTPRGENEATRLAEAGRRVLGWRALMPVEEALGKILALNKRALLEREGELERISLQTFNPLWFTEYCIRLLGRSEALKLLRMNREAVRPFICINPRKAGKDEAISKISKHGIKLESVDACPLLYRVVDKPTTLTNLEEYREGVFFPQNMAGCLSVLAQRPEADSTVFDIGAAHIYKAAYAALLTEGKGRILSIDHPPRRVRGLKKALDRLGIENIDVLAADVYEEIPFTVRCDIIYLTAPSTGSGAFWRTANKWRSFSLQRMVNTQWRMLNLCAEHLKRGGCLVYSTSSLLVEENELVIERFLKWHPEFTLAEVRPCIGVPGLRCQEEALRLYPHTHYVDGSYTAKLVKE